MREVCHTFPEDLVRNAQDYVVKNMSIEAYGPRVMEVYRAVLN